MVKIAIWVLAIGVLSLAVAEIFLRVRYGLGNPPLYVADARTGYRLAPHQTLRRRGNRIAINAYSMRGPATSPHRTADTLRVLMVGDSIVNGGGWTDQSELLSLQVQAALEPLKPAEFQQVEVLNASANSWGPRNELGYVLRFGTFEAQVVLLVINTDDLFAIAPNSYDLGRNPHYPTRRPPLALWEAVARRRKYTPSAELQALHDQGGDRVGVNLEAIRQLNQVVKAAGGQLAIAMTPLRRELEDGPRDYEQIARQRLTAFAQAEGLPYLNFLPRFQQTRYEPLYYDHIHLSPEGNRWVGQALSAFVAEVLHQQPPVPFQLPSHDPLSDLW
ncbi:SGNH/GDSL hydrolase family protein [Nodosilinea sp. LEGE 07298]|uniref:SGNH/GDSL hydrolase family protein n=1 Tax=Nodosilinea sp. LEGE 07298 TaxID=2777970 RepID=UPI001D14D217|nr:SGNH/GDSL hydrolase family protein [Nodosilinea sp. LEGE 07298]